MLLTAVTGDCAERVARAAVRERGAAVGLDALACDAAAAAVTVIV